VSEKREHMSFPGTNIYEVCKRCGVQRKDHAGIDKPHTFEPQSEKREQSAPWPKLAICKNCAQPIRLGADYESWVHWNSMRIYCDFRPVAVPAPEAQGEWCPLDLTEQMVEWLNDTYKGPYAGTLTQKLWLWNAELRKEEVMPTESRSRSTTDTRPSGEVAGGPLGFCKDKYHFGSHPKTDSCVDWLSEVGGPTESSWLEIARLPITREDLAELVHDACWELSPDEDGGPWPKVEDIIHEARQLLKARGGESMNELLEQGTESPWHEIAEKWHEANWFKSSSRVKLHERLIELVVEATLVWCCERLTLRRNKTTEHHKYEISMLLAELLEQEGTK
jgi:hypothetical protein